MRQGTLYINPTKPIFRQINFQAFTYSERGVTIEEHRGCIITDEPMIKAMERIRCHYSLVMVERIFLSDATASKLCIYDQTGLVYESD